MRAYRPRNLARPHLTLPPAVLPDSGGISEDGHEADEGSSAQEEQGLGDAVEGEDEEARDQSAGRGPDEINRVEGSARSAELRPGGSRGQSGQ